MNIHDRFREIRRILAEKTGGRTARRKPTVKPQQLELSLPVLRRRQAS